MSRLFLLTGALSFAFCLGCNQAPPEKPAAGAHDEHDHDHEHGHDHDHAHEGHDHEHAHGEELSTYDAAVAKIVAARDTIRDSLAAGEKDKADEALHEVGHVLEDTPALAEKAELSDEDKAAVKKDIDELFDLYGKLDEQIHGDLEITYDEFSEKIDAVVERLQARLEMKQ